MQACEFVLDTYVLQIAQDYEADTCLAAASLLNEIQDKSKGHCIVLDIEDDIRKEYHNNINPRSIVGKWWRLVQAFGKIQYYSHSLSRRHTDELTQRLSFHDDDLKFVGVASRTASKLLVAEESDYTKPITDYLQQRLQVTVLPIAEALLYAKDP